MSDLLPPSATPYERALASASERIESLPVIYRQLWNPDTCPLEFLPYLAWSFSVDEWDESWPEHIKRQTVKDSLYQHRIKGSRQSIENAIAAFNAQARIIEWWEQNPKAEPHTFEVWLNATQNERVLPVLEYNREDQFYCSQAIPVNTSRVYRVKFKVRQITDDVGKTGIYAGVTVLDKAFKGIEGSLGYPRRHCVAINQQISASEGWLELEGEISGIGSDQNKFEPGTVYIRPHFWINRTNGTGVAQVAELECWDLFDNKQLVPNPHFTNGKTGWSQNYSGETVTDNAPGNVKSTSFGLTADLQTSIIAAINAVKPLRSHFTVNTGVSSSGLLNVVGVSRLLNFKRLEMTA